MRTSGPIFLFMWARSVGIRRRRHGGILDALAAMLVDGVCNARENSDGYEKRNQDGKPQCYSDKLPWGSGRSGTSVADAGAIRLVYSRLITNVAPSPTHRKWRRASGVRR